MHVLDVYSYFVLKECEECSTEGDVRDGMGRQVAKLTRYKSIKILSIATPAPHDIKRLIRLSSTAQTNEGDYRAMICHLFLNKTEIPNIQKIISQPRGCQG